ncbi:sensor histidine kinase [Ideonella sp. A 288]|uniref:sensor histidine kinase n=1 Tax=Ideonella sp. A 288 TaxID=1962181 RepID=UPI000B4BCC3A|nr:histidine kinase [Ideonella sp. A 288]
MSTPNAGSPRSPRWQQSSATIVRAFHAYAGWLVTISWKRFFLLSLLLLVSAGILQNVPPFRWTYTERVSSPESAIVITPPTPPAPPSAPRREPIIKIDKPRPGSKTEGVEISIDERGIRITPRSPAAASAASAAASGASAGATAASAPVVDIRLPEGVTSEAVKEAVQQARREIEDAVRAAKEEARDAAEAARLDAEEAAREAAEATQEAARAVSRGGTHEQTRTVRFGDALPELAFLWILASAVIKITYKRQIQAEAQAAQAVETAEAESLRRQVLEARMAAMQAQVEPHFLFNTLASIDHLIEVDPKRASVMQKNLIALLRASMPTMREAGDGGPRDLGRELSVIRPYLEILKVRMEERLTTDLRVPDGLLSAEFPQMMVQTLVENAIKHGLEPKPEGGNLEVRAEILHGKLAVTVADTGLGFGRAATAGTGVGLANIRERLQLLYGSKAALTITENPGGGTVATITVPYKPLQGDTA